MKTRLTMGLGATFALVAASAFPALARQRITLVVVSSPRPDLVSGGDALVEAKGATAGARVSVNGAPASALLRDARTGKLVALVTGLKEGSNRVTIGSGRGADALTIINHSRNGPILSGPQLQPYECRTENAGLGPAVDVACNAPARVDYFYRASDGSFKPLPTGSRPVDLISTTTIEGRTVPYIVRVETGTLNRSIYRIAVLDAVDEHATDRWGPGAGWNGRLAVQFGGGLAGRYEQGFNRAQDVLNDLYLSRGFAFVIASGLVNGLASNAVVQGETLMMLKEHFIEAYGVPRWTLGTGGSGGGIQQLNITALYPGLLDGLQPSVPFADSQIANQVLDCDLLERHFSKEPGRWTDAKRAAVTGFASANTCRNWKLLIAPSLKITNKPACGLKKSELAYDPKSNVRGARCGIYPWLVNELGRDPATGFERKPLDNVGLQYGLKALNEGAISVDEFLALNADVGGFDGDLQYVAARTVGDPVALRRAYATGLINSGGGGLGIVPIVQYRTYQDPFGDIHDRQRDFDIRLRLERANGDAENQIIMVGPKGESLLKPTTVDIETPALDIATAWLDAISADPSPLTHEKVVRLKPVAAVDAWYDQAGRKHAEKATADPTTAFNRAYPIYANPRMVAGSPLTNDVLKCRLKPISMRDYKVAFSGSQAARLRQIFPTGVCDFSKPGIGSTKQLGTFIRY